MISDRDLVALQAKGETTHGPPMPRADALAYLERRKQWPAALTRQVYRLVPVPSCRCCGEPAWANLRCTKHQDRNPCAAEGCTRTRAARGWLSDSASLCGEHWRAYVPPGSPIRRAINRLARVAKKAGYRRTDRWPEELERRYWRLWEGVIRRVRRPEREGHIDQASIEKLFGWD